MQLGILHEQTSGLVELAAGARRDGRLQITTRRRADHFLPGGTGGGEWLGALLGLAARHVDRGEEVFVAPAVRASAGGEKRAVSETRWLWVDVDRPGQLHVLWAFLAERPCHLLVETAGSGGVHAYWLLAQPLPASHVNRQTGELVEPIERANLRIVHHLGVGPDGKPNVADPACAERSRVMRLAGTVNGKTGEHARILEADLALPALPDPAARRRPARPGRRYSPPRHRAGRRTRTRTSGSARASTSSDSPGSSSRATGSSTAQRTRTGSRPARSGRMRARGGDVTPAAAGHGARSTTSRRCCSAGHGARSCAARRSSVPART